MELLREREFKGVPIGNLTSQLFANVYMDPFDHFIKEKLHIRQYLRYTDDFILLYDNPVELVSLLPIIRRFLAEQLRLDLHPRKVELRKLSQGIDFLGYVTLPNYRVLRTKTKCRMLRRLDVTNIASYLGLIQHSHGHALASHLIERASRDNPSQLR